MNTKVIKSRVSKFLPCCISTDSNSDRIIIRFFKYKSAKEVVEQGCREAKIPTIICKEGEEPEKANKLIVTYEIT